MAIDLTAAAEERVRVLHQQALVFVCHDHTIFPENVDAMRRGGVTAKQVQVCTDGQVWADQATLWSSATRRELLGELTRVGAGPDVMAAAEGPTVAAQPRDGFLRRALTTIDYLYWQVEQSAGALRIALEPEDIVQAKRDGAVALVLGSEGARLTEGRLEILRVLARLGLRHIGLSWAWAGPAGAPQSDTSGRGLTSFGRQLIADANDLGIIIDLAHLSEASIREAIPASRAPLLMSHSGAAALNPTQPVGVLLPDDLIRALAARGGVVAVHFMSQVVKPGRSLASIDQVVDQFEYITSLVGIDSVACGPDYLQMDPRLWENWMIEPFSYAEGLEDIGQMANLTRRLVGRGFSDEAIHKILGGNLLRLFSSVRDHRTAASDIYDRTEIGRSTEGCTPL